MGNSELLPEVVARWTKYGIARSGAKRESIEQAQRRYGVRWPDALTALLGLADGMEDGTMDELMIRFLPVEEIKLAIEEFSGGDPRQYEGFFVFADYSLWSHGYSVNVAGGDGSGGEGAVAIVGGHVPIVVASSFEEFVENYLRCPERLFVTKY